MFIPGGCFCCEPPEDPCTLSGCTWSSTSMSDTDLTPEVAYKDGPDGEYEVSNDQDATTGNDPACRKIRIETVVPPEHPDVVYAICWKDNATHNPSTQCPLTNVSFCVESKRHGDSNPGSELSDGVVFVVRQGGKIYATTTQSVGVNWKRASGTYTSSQFNWIAGAGTPNFTATGTSIEFGFALRLNVGADEEPLDVVLFDNLCITKVAGCVSCAAGVCGTLTQGGWSTSLGYEKIQSPSGTTTPSPQRASATSGGPDNSVNVIVDTTGLSQKSLASVIDTGVVIDPSTAYPGCREISLYDICFDLRVDSNPATVDEVSIRFKQNGCYFGQGAVTNNRLPLYFGGFSLARCSVTNADTPSPWSFAYSVRLCGNATDRFDSSQPFEIAVAVFSANADGGTLSFSVDNICINAVYGACKNGCCPDDMLVTYSGNVWTETGPCANDFAAVNAYLASGIAITKGTGTLSNGFSTSLSKWGHYHTFPSTYNAANTIHISVWAELVTSLGKCTLRLYTFMSKTGPGINPISQGVAARYWDIATAGGNFWQECVSGGAVSAVSFGDGNAQGSNNSGCNPQSAGATVTVVDL